MMIFDLYKWTGSLPPSQGPNASRNRDCHVGCDRFRLPGFLDGSWYLNVDILLMVPVPPGMVLKPGRQNGIWNPSGTVSDRASEAKTRRFGIWWGWWGPCWGCQGWGSYVPILNEERPFRTPEFFTGHRVTLYSFIFGVGGYLQWSLPIKTCLPHHWLVVTVPQAGKNTELMQAISL